jgi:hypothetical protein
MKAYGHKFPSEIRFFFILLSLLFRLYFIRICSFIRDKF